MPIPGRGSEPMTSAAERLSLLQAVESRDLDVEQAIRAIEAAKPGVPLGLEAEAATPTAWIVLLGRRSPSACR